MADTGLVAHALGKDPSSLARPTDPARGALLETFVVDEILKQAGWLDVDVRLHHLRDRDGAEVDLVIEGSDGRVVAVEVKASSTVGPADARWLAWLRAKVNDDFVVGVVFHTGRQAFSLGDRLVALPISHLWRFDLTRPE